MNAPGSYRWLIVAVTVLNQAVVTGIGLYCFAIFSIPWLEQFEISRSQLALAITSLMIVNGLITPYIGQRLDRLSLLWPVILGFAVFCSGLGLLSVANAYWQIILIYATFVALGQLLAGTFVSQMLINRWFTTDNGLALGISATGTSLGGLLFPLLIAQALSRTDLATVLQSLALVLAVVLIPINYIALRTQPPTSQGTSTPDSPTANPLPTWTTPQILRSAAFWIPLSTILAVTGSFIAIQANLGAHLNDLNFSTAVTGQMIAIISATMIIGKLLYGRLADQLDHAYLLFFMGCTSIAGLTLLMLTSDKMLLMVAAGILGIASGGLIPVQGVVFAARFGIASFGKVLGLVMLVMILASLGSVYAAWVYDLLGSYHYAFLSLILITIPGLVLLRWLPPPLRTESNRERSTDAA